MQTNPPPNPVLEEDSAIQDIIGSTQKYWNMGGKVIYQS